MMLLHVPWRGKPSSISQAEMYWIRYWCASKICTLRVRTRRCHRKISWSGCISQQHYCGVWYHNNNCILLKYTNYTSVFIFVPQTEGEGVGDIIIAFDTDPVGVASCLHSIYWTNRWILTKLAQTHYWEGEKKWLDFGDNDLIFKVTSALSNFDQKSLSAPYLLNQMTDSGQTSCVVTLG